MAEYVTDFPVSLKLEDGQWHVVEPMFERRERVVRCRDCEYAHPCPLADSEKLMCALHDEMFVNSNDFCAWGETTEEEP